MDAQPFPDKNWWVLSFLVRADEDGVSAVSAEGRFKIDLWNGDGPQPLASTVMRFRDLAPSEQDQWRLLWQRDDQI